MGTELSEPEKVYVCIDCDNHWQDKKEKCPKCGAEKNRIIEYVKLK